MQSEINGKVAPQLTHPRGPALASLVSEPTTDSFNVVLVRQGGGQCTEEQGTSSLLLGRSPSRDYRVSEVWGGLITGLCWKEGGCARACNICAYRCTTTITGCVCVSAHINGRENCWDCRDAETTTGEDAEWRHTKREWGGTEIGSDRDSERYENRLMLWRRENRGTKGQKSKQPDTNKGSISRSNLCHLWAVLYFSITACLLSFHLKWNFNCQV